LAVAASSWAVKMGRAKLKIYRMLPVSEKGDRKASLAWTSETLRHQAMGMVAFRAGISPRIIWGMDAPRKFCIENYKHKVLPAGMIYIGAGNKQFNLRRSQWANPFEVGRDGDAEECTRCFSYDFSKLGFRKYLHKIDGKDLVCDCKDGSPCHSEVITMEWVSWKRGFSELEEPKAKVTLRARDECGSGGIISKLLRKEATPGDESENPPPRDRERRSPSKKRSPRMPYRRSFKGQKRWRSKVVTLVAAAVASSNKALRVVDVQLKQGRGNTRMSFRGMFLPDFTNDILVSSVGGGTNQGIDMKWADCLDEGCPFIAVGFSLKPTDAYAQVLKREEDLRSERAVDPVLGWNSEEERISFLLSSDSAGAAFDKAYDFATSMMGEFQLSGELDWRNSVRFLMGLAMIGEPAEIGIFVSVLESEMTSRRELLQHPELAVQKIEFDKNDKHQEFGIAWSMCKEEQLGVKVKKPVVAKKIVGIGGFIQNLREKGGNPVAPLEAAMVSMALKECEDVRHCLRKSSRKI